MTVNIALLRAVNVAGTSPVRMAELRDLLARNGLLDVKTLLQSGNVVFRSGATSPSRLEQRLQTLLSEGLKVSAEVFVRSAAEWRELVLRNPFPQEASKDPARLVVTVLKRAPSPEAWSSLKAANRGPEVIRGVDRHAYIVYPNGMGRSKLTGALIERKLGTTGTSRNWNTVGKLDRMASG